MYAKLKKLARPEFIRAVAYWILRKSTRIQVHDILAISLQQQQQFALENTENGYQIFKVSHGMQLPDPLIEQQLNEQSGASCRELIKQGHHVYYAVDVCNVAVQLNILHGEIRVDSPTNLLFSTAPEVIFLNYLHTRPEYRGLGLANRLIEYACRDQGELGLRRCLAHVRSTNYASHRAFGKAGWKRLGKIVTTKSGRLLSTPGCDELGLSVRKPQSAG